MRWSEVGPSRSCEQQTWFSVPEIWSSRHPNSPICRALHVSMTICSVVETCFQPPLDPIPCIHDRCATLAVRAEVWLRIAMKETVSMTHNLDMSFAGPLRRLSIITMDVTHSDYSRDLHTFFWDSLRCNTRRSPEMQAAILRSLVKT